MTLTKLREIAMAATQGQWKYEDERYSAKCVIGMRPEDDRWLASCQPEFNGRSNGKYIATFSPAMVLKLLDCVEALEAVKNCIDTDSVKTKTDDGEIEYWVSDQQVQLICDKALAALEGTG